MVVQPQQPTYRFAFDGGIGTIGTVRRQGPVLGEAVHRIHYVFDDLPLVHGRGRPLPIMAADLLDVCGALVLADRLARRAIANDPRPPHDRWHRCLEVVVPVRQPTRWRHPEVLRRLHTLLGWLTDDRWNIAFTQRTLQPRPAEAQQTYLLPDGGSTSICLHSGGLDSLFGLIQLITQPSSDLIRPVTVASSGRVLATTRAVVHHLRTARSVSAPELHPATLRLRISASGRPRDDREPSQRARVLLFLAAGVAVATVAGAEGIQVTENGVGAISLPMTADHWGARATKAMHPWTLLIFSELAALVLDRPLSITNSGLLVTKGELARQTLANGLFADAARATVSCDRAPYLRRGHACGQCTSCLLRRVALHAVGLMELVDGRAVTYDTDWLDPMTPRSNSAAIPFMAMQHQVEQLRVAMAQTGGFPHLACVFPDLLSMVALAPHMGLSSVEAEGALLRLFQSYVGEFDAFVHHTKRRGGREKVVPLAAPTPVVAAG